MTDQFDPEVSRNQLLEQIPSGVGIFDVSGDVIRQEYLNDGYYQMVHSTREERRRFSGAGTVNAIFPDDRAGLLEEARASIREGRMLRFRFRLLDGGGAYRWVAIRANHRPVSGAERFYASYYDIDELMRTQEKLKNDELVLRDLLRYSDTVHFLYDPRRHRYEILEMPAALSKLPSAMDDFPESLIRRAIPDPESADAYREMVRRIDRGEREAECAVRIRYLERKMWYRVHLINILDSTGRPDHAVGYAVNIDSFMKAERTYQEIKLRVASLESEILSASCFNVTQDRTIEVNPGWLKSAEPQAEGLYAEAVEAEPAIAVQSEATRAVMLSAASQIPDAEQRRSFFRLCSNAGMKRLCEAGCREKEMEYRRLTPRGLIWVSTRLSLQSDPQTGDLLAFFNTADINDRVIYQKITDRILGKNYETVSYYDTHTGLLYLKSLEGGSGISFTPVNYEAAAAEAVEQYVSTGEARGVLEKFRMETILHALEREEIYTIYYTGKQRDESLPGHPFKRMKADLYYLDGTRDIVVILQTNATAIYLREREQVRRREETLRREEHVRSLEAVVGGIPAGVAVFKKDRGTVSVLMANQFLCQLVRASRERILSRPWAALIREGTHPDDLQTVLDGVDRLFSDENSVSMTYRTRSEDSDQYFWISAVGQAVQNPDGSKTAYVLYTDATEQKRREAEFAQRVSELTSGYPNLLSALHLDLTANRCLEARSTVPFLKEKFQLGTVDEELMALAGLVADSALRAELPSRFGREELLRRFHAGETRLSLEYPILYPDGRLYWRLGTLSMLQNPATGNIEAVAYATDISERKRDEEIIRHIAEEKFDYVAILNLDTDRLEFHNMRPGMTDVPLEMNVRYEYETCQGFILRAIPTPEERAEYSRQSDLSAVRRELERGGRYSFSYSCPRGDAVARQLVQYSWLNREHKLVLVIRSDITETYHQEQTRLHQLQQALHQAEEASRAKTEFVSRISHDIRTPIGIITNMTNFALADLHDEAAATDDLKKIQASSTFLLSLINDVLDISKIDSGKIELHPEPYRFEEHSANILNVLRPMCEERGLKCVFERRQKNCGVIVADRTRLNQITLNLLSNAVKYTLPGGTVSYISDSEDLPDAKVRFGFEIRDTGIGMSEEFQKRMFEPFSQEYENPDRPKGMTGTGLGLSIVKRMVDLMDGTLRISSAPGRGTVVRCDIVFPDALRDPVWKDRILPAGQTEAAAQPLAGKVLLAEDNAINMEIAVRILKSLGLRADRAENGVQAVERFSVSLPGEYRAILMDIQMPVMNGYEAAENIRSLSRPDAASIPIIAMTADAFRDAADRARRAGMTGYVTKPLDPELIRKALTGL